MGAMPRGTIVLLVAAGLGLVAFDVVPAPYVLGPVIGYGIYRVGTATFSSLERGASYVPSGPPQPVDLAVEQVTYWCDGCGAEVLLLVRGTDSPPRHCGERMHERREESEASDRPSQQHDPGAVGGPGD